MTSPANPSDDAARLKRALISLDGLSVGDALGENFFNRVMLATAARRRAPRGPWRYTDDTEMALGILETLKEFGHIDRDALAKTFARRYMADRGRGYGPMAHTILEEIHGGRPWREAAGEPFKGTGSMGNGGAMRAAPLGAWFADDLDALVENADASAEVTHMHPEGRAGAVAVALAAAWAWNHREDPGRKGEEMLDLVLERTPDSQTRDGVAKARNLGLDFDPRTVAAAVGNGSGIVAIDTVPFCLWRAASCLDDYPEAMWTTIEVMGDIDTNCAIVGGIVALSAKGQGVPAEWVAAREGLQF